MANAIRKFIESLWEVQGDMEGELDYPEEQSTSYYYEEEEPEQERRQSSRRSSQSNVTAFPSAYSGKVIIYRPVSYEDTQNIIDNLKANKTVIVNMEQIEVETAQRILDFMSGASYAINAKVFKISARIFVASPACVKVVTSSDGSNE